jgi:ketosteroid isomerase-like protein
VSRQNLEIVQRGWEHFTATGEPLEEIIAPDFVWDMSKFRDLVGIRPRYDGVDGMRRFLRDWTEPFEEWSVEAESMRDTADKVVIFCRQRGRSKIADVPVDMSFAQVVTLRDGLYVRMEMYADWAEALEAAGLASSEPPSHHG